MRRHQSHRRLRLMIEAMEPRTLLSVGTLTGATYNFGNSPGPDCADPVRNTAYVVNSGDNQILAINTSSGNVAGYCTAAADVSGLGVSVDDGRLFASEPGAFQVEVFSLPGMTLLKTLNVGVAVGQIFGIANDRIAGTTSSGVTIFDAGTGASLYSFANAYGGLVRINTAGTDIYTRDQGLSGDDGGVNVWNVSGTGAPINEAQIPGPTGMNEEDYAVDPVGGKAYLEDGGVDGIEVTLLSNGAQTTWGFVGGGGPGISVAALENGAYVYGMTAFGTIVQFSQTGVALAYITLPNYGNADSMVITPNGNPFYTWGSGIGIINLGTLSGSTVSHLAFATQPPSALSGSPISPAVVVDIETPGGNIVGGDNSDVTLSLASGAGALAGTTTVAAVNGVATFNNVAITGTGSYTLTASDGSDDTTTSNAFAVSAPHLAFVQQPTSVLDGVTISPAVTVEVLDENSQVITDDDSNVTLSLASGAGTLGGTVTVAAASGIAAFSNINVTGTGSFTLTASDGSDVAATSSTFAVAVPHLAFVAQPQTVLAGAAMTSPVTVELLNASNQILTGDTSDVTLSLATGTGALSGTDTVAAVNGVATFNNISIIGGSGTHTLLAADGSYASADSNTFTVTVPHLAFVQQPTNANANMALSPAVTVEVLSPSDQVVTSDNSDTVTLAVASGPGALSGTVTAAVQNGVARFNNISVGAAGTFTLLATDGIDTSATSNTFSVIVRHLAFIQQPENVTAGDANSPAITVEIEDQNNNIITAGSVNITLAVENGASSALNGTLTAASVNGLATFSGISIDSSGDYTLSANDGGDGSALSSAFTVAPAVAAQLAFTPQPTTALVGDAITPPIVVNVEDQYGNVVSTDGSQVNLSIASRPDGGTLQGTASIAALSGSAAFPGLSLSKAGTYTLTASDGSLTPATSGAFTITLPPPSPFVPSFAGVNLASSVVAGGKFKAHVPVIVSNSGSNFKGFLTINFYADTTSTLDGNQVLLTSISKKLSLATFRHGLVTGNIKSLPSNLPDGIYYILAEVVDPNKLINVAATSTTVKVAAPFIQPTVSIATVTPTEIAAGKSGSIVVTLTNSGNIPAGGISLTLAPSVDGVNPVSDVSLGSIHSGLTLPPGKTRRFNLHFKTTDVTTPGTYYPYVSVSLGGVSTSVAGTSQFTIG